MSPRPDELPMPSLFQVPPLLNRAKGPVAIVAILFFASSLARAQQEAEPVDDISGNYQFLSADDTLALLEEEGKLKGYIDVYQGEEESDAVLSYPITLGSRKKNRVELKTAKIHQKYYRFEGIVQRGAGHEERDPDYLQLVGDLSIVTVKGDTGEEVTQRMHVIFKSKGQSEEGED